jgi:predicted branched-subunit amino acid permease
MRTPYQSFLRGFQRTLAYQTGVVPFGILYGSLAIGIGFTWWLAILLTLVVFGGSSQLVFMDLYGHLSSAFQAVLGANIVNARHLIYSAGVSSEFSAFSKRWRFLLTYLLTDQLYAVSVSRKQEIQEISQVLKPWYYFGAGFCNWFFWLIANCLGIAFGHFIPKSWNLGFSIPLMFMPLVFAMSKNKYDYLTCLAAAALVFILQKLPYGLGVFFAIVGASFIGFYLQKWMESKK